MKKDCKNIRCVSHSTNHEFNCMEFTSPYEECINFTEMVFTYYSEKDKIDLLSSGKYNNLTCKEFRELVEE